jgi:hypothetical protein
MGLLTWSGPTRPVPSTLHTTAVVPTSAGERSTASSSTVPHVSTQ